MCRDRFWVDRGEVRRVHPQNIAFEIERVVAAGLKHRTHLFIVQVIDVAGMALAGLRASLKSTTELFTFRHALNLHRAKAAALLQPAKRAVVKPG